MENIVIIVSALALIATPAVAQDSTASERIAYSDLNLGSAGGKATLEQRIRAAASRVCETGSGEQSLRETLAGRACYQTSIADGLHQMDQLIAARNSGTVMAATIVVAGMR